MKKQGFYGNFAKLYDTFKLKKDYEGEVKKIIQLIEKYKESKGLRLLDVACGTGRHLDYFKKRYYCEGIDINKQMILVAKEKVKGVKFHCNDMAEFSLNKKFDVITCLYASIMYVKTLALLHKTLKNLARHLECGGVIVIEPYWTRKDYLKRKINNINIEQTNEKNIKIARVTVSTVKDKLLTRDKITIIVEKNKIPVVFKDRRISGLFEKDEILEAMKQAGLKPKFLKNGLNYNWGLYIGVKR